MYTYYRLASVSYFVTFVVSESEGVGSDTCKVSASAPFISSVWPLVVYNNIIASLPSYKLGAARFGRV